jgi:hypothetical protein
MLNLANAIRNGRISRGVHATACVFLACKVDDNPRDVNALVKILGKHPIFGAELSKAFSGLLSSI